MLNEIRPMHGRTREDHRRNKGIADIAANAAYHIEETHRHG
jgi:hypothetical protein